MTTDTSSTMTDAQKKTFIINFLSEAKITEYEPVWLSRPLTFSKDAAAVNYGVDLDDTEAIDALQSEYSFEYRGHFETTHSLDFELITMFLSLPDNEIEPDMQDEADMFIDKVADMFNLSEFTD